MKPKWFILTWVMGVAACSPKQAVQPALPTLPVANGSPVMVVIDQSKPGYALPTSFAGLSYETGILTKSPRFLVASNKVLIQLIKNLGPGSLRIGGNSSDNIYWTGRPRSTTTGTDSLATTDIDSLAAFVKAINWPVLFGLNLGSAPAAIAASEAAYVATSLKSSLYAFQVGNEPDLFSNNGHRSLGYTYQAYQQEWNTYRAAAQKVVPQASFAGPDVADNTQWMSSFAGSEAKTINLVDGHYYRTGPASNTAITYQSLLAPATKLPAYLQALNQASLTAMVPYRISECNSVYDGGKAGVSDVFAAALWALDFMWTVAETNGQGINFHGGSGGAYSPIVIQNGVVVARPDYYAMLAFSYGSQGATLLPAVLNQTAYNCSAYACTNGAKVLITLLNKEVTTNLSFTINLGKTASTVTIARLVASSLTATSGITFAGNAVNSDGTYTPGAVEQYEVNQPGFVINVPAGSAAVIVAQ